MKHIHKLVVACAHKVRPATQPVHIMYCVMAAGVLHEYYAAASGVLAVILFVEWVAGEE